jgi:hypothetical protein
MESTSLLPTTPPLHFPLTTDHENTSYSVGVWESVSVSTSHGHSQSPCPRSLHAAAVWGDKMLIFGGYDVI